MDIVLEISEEQIKGALFEGKKGVDSFAFPVHPKDSFLAYLANKPIANALLASVHASIAENVKKDLESKNIHCHFLDHKNLKLTFDIDDPETLPPRLIANAYGALARFPINDCILVDVGPEISVHFIAKEGHYLGGLTCPLKYASPFREQPESALGKTAATRHYAGIYYGALGAIERMIAELSLTALSPSSVKIVATGDIQATAFAEDLKELVDQVDPLLTLIGLHEILDEILLKKG